jgi:two-component system, NtrC family, nitrogen regulation sensor histidine kinase NtrY
LYFRYIFPRKHKILSYFSLFILIWMLLVKGVSYYVSSKVDENSSQILAEKNSERAEYCTKEFIKTRDELLNFSAGINGNLDIRKNIEKGELKKLIETLSATVQKENISFEIFDRRIESVYYSGRQVYPEILLIQDAFAGNTPTVIKEAGFFTYLLNYSPIRSLSDGTSVSGVLVTAVMIDSKYRSEQFDFSFNFLTQDANQKFGNRVFVLPVSRFGSHSQNDSVTGYNACKLRTSDEKIIGNLFFPVYTIEEHKAGIENFSARTLAVLGLLLTVTLFPLLIKLIILFRSSTVKIILIFVALLLMRYVWIYFGFPTKVFESEIFQPQYFASTLGGGIFKSLGELFVTVFFLLVFTVYSVKLSFESIYEHKSSKRKNSLFQLLAGVILLTLVFYGLNFLYGLSVRSLVVDSNINFLDKTNIIPGLPLFIIQFVILIISASYLFFNIIIIIAALNQFRHLSGSVFFRRIYMPVLLLIYIFINEAVNLFSVRTDLSDIVRIIVITLLFLLGYYFFRSGFGTPGVFSLRNVSFVMLLCIITTPVIVLEITKSQEINFIENIGTELAETQSDKTIYMLSEVLGELKGNPDIEKFIRDEYKTPKLAYYLFSSSKFSYDNYKTDFLILDTSKRIISDFNSSNNLINPDSVLAFVRRNLFSKKFMLNVPDSDTAEYTVENWEDYTDNESEVPEPMMFDGITILENKNEKYFAGLLPLERIEFRNTTYEEIIGYLIITVNYESISLFSENRYAANINFRPETIFNRLLSRPAITEFSNGEIVNSTDIEISRSIEKNLPLFRESVKNSVSKTAWRYDKLINENYRTYYIIAGNKEDEEAPEVIFTLSVKRDDFRVLMFYFLKYMLFALIVFIGFYVVYITAILFQFRNLRFKFREKLFISFLIVSVIPIIFLAVYTRTYINDKNYTSYSNRIASDLSLLNETLKDEKTLFNKFKSADTVRNAAREVLNKNFLNSPQNYNIFIKNKLIASTNEELFKSDFLDTRVGNEGYLNIILLKKDIFLLNKNINGQDFILGYKPLKDRSGTVNGILSSLSVYRQKEIEEELTETLTFIFGSYFFVIIVLLVIVSFITAKISRPILIMKEATTRISKGEEDVIINVNRSDEIGDLVDSFNKMSRELAKSKENLKKAEREAAWRDIARRVAHEIKNPLTPMKLSIQHLYNMFLEKDMESFEKVLIKTRDLITVEIDKLNKIATAFSDFAKLPRRNYEPMNINDVLEDIISLYSLDKKIEFVKDLSPGLHLISADRLEMNRVFQNLIKNAVQSIRHKGRVEVKSWNDGDFVIVVISDNGHGIEPDILNKLFEPNFSTKSTGMGLGLTISKKSLDDMKARISISSKVNEGTKVEIRFRRNKLK